MGYKNPDKQREFQRLWQRKMTIKLKNDALTKLGNQCVKCGVNDSRVLEVDHIKPHLTQKEETGSLLWRKIRLNKIDLLKLQLLCANCHRIKTIEDRKYFRNWKG